MPPPLISDTSSAVSPTKIIRDIIPYVFHLAHPQEHIIGDLQRVVLTRRQEANVSFFACFLSQLDPTKYQLVLRENNWVEAMQYELMQFTKMHVWEMCPCPEGVTQIGIKWVFRNKTNERGIFIKRNKARLVVLGYLQDEGI